MNHKHITTLIALLFILNFSFAQKYFPGTITKINGEIINGYIRIPKYANDKTVKFRNSEKSFEREIRSDSVRLISIQTKGGAINTLERIPITKKSKGFVILLIEGYANLYIAGEGISANKEGEFTPNTSYFSGRDLPTFNYLALRKNEKVATVLAVASSSPTVLGLNNTFRVFASKYFADYPELVKRIEKKEFSHDDVEKVVKIYNKHMEENQNK
ncbi:MAG: hypothetical protein Q7U54_14800 [Bacteroidales bacterium]|nr:hypothetical protein [Bacteroidales bacterium]